MNVVVAKAMKLLMDEYANKDYDGYLPDVEVGEVVELNDIWDGKGEVPEESYSYQLTNNDWINYTFEVIEEAENELDTTIRITDISLL